MEVSANQFHIAKQSGIPRVIYGRTIGKGKDITAGTAAGHTAAVQGRYHGNASELCLNGSSQVHAMGMYSFRKKSQYFRNPDDNRIGSLNYSGRIPKMITVRMRQKDHIAEYIARGNIRFLIAIQKRIKKQRQ